VKTPQSEKLKPTTIRLPDGLLKRAKIHAVEFNTTLQQIIIEALDAKLSGEGQWVLREPHSKKHPREGK
jgi:hypothetical protein